MTLNRLKRQNNKKKVFTLDSIFVKMHAENKYEAIEIAGKILVKQGKVQVSYIDAMKEREDLLSTYIGNGIAIPHGVGKAKEQIIESGISVVQFPEGVDFDKKQKAYIVIGIAGKGDEHLDILANIALICEDEKRVKKLVSADSASEIYEMLTEELS